MSNITGNEPAMPLSIASDVNNIYSTLQANGGEALCGLTIRQELASRAMSALIIAKPDQIHNQVEGCQVAMAWADAMINQFNKS